jgi:hypothetical protein
VSDNDNDLASPNPGLRIGRIDFLKLAGLSVGAALTGVATVVTAAKAEDSGAAETGWAKGIRIIFEAGGNTGDAFAQIVVNGAQ